MRTSTEISVISKLVGEEKAVEEIARAGFDGWDFSMIAMWDCDWGKRIYTPTDHPLAKSDYLAFARKIRRIGEENGICCNQSHAPFPCYYDKFSLIEDTLKRAIECTAEAGGKICIIHPDVYETAEKNCEMHLRLLPFAKDHGVKIATENMYSWNREKNEAAFGACGTSEDFKRHLDLIPDDFYVACLDIGHAEIMRDEASAVEMICTLGDKLQALHLHDCDKHFDTHDLPFTKSVDFDSVVDALARIDYKGWFTLEANGFTRALTEDNYVEGLATLYKSAQRLESMFFKRKQGL